MPRLKKKASLALTRSANACLFCKSEEDNVEVYGKMLKKQGITIHYFCMLFSSGLWQRGKKEKDGILGFLPADIFREQKRGSRLTCQYCRKKGATIGCVISNCRKTFHFRCGREAGVLSQFFQQFRSYCPDHRPFQETHTSDRLAFYGTAKSTCSICTLSVEARASNDTLRSPCCRNAWFHRSCIQRYALSAGAYFFKCPLCNNKELFEVEMLEFGIYIPEQDAAWEQEPSAFHELLERYSRCDVNPCGCPDGPLYTGPTGSQWELLLCDWCGSSGSHKSCHGFRRVGKENLCKECAQFSVAIAEDKASKGRKKCSTSPIAVLSEEDVRRRLGNRLAASLRAERAARRQNASSSDALQEVKSAHKGHRGRVREDVLKAVASTQSGRAPAVAPADFLKDHRLTRSKPVVCVERTDSESEVSVDCSTDWMTPLSGCGSHISSGLSSNRSGENSTLELDWPEAEMTRTCSEHSAVMQSSYENAQVADRPQAGSFACWHDIPAGDTEPTSEHIEVVSHFLPADISQPSECTGMVCTPQSPGLSPTQLSFGGDMVPDMMDVRDLHKHFLRTPSQRDHEGANMVQNVPSPLCSGSEAVISGLGLSEQDAYTSETSNLAAYTVCPQREQQNSSVSGQKRGPGRPRKICQNPYQLWLNCSSTNSDNRGKVTNKNTSGCMTRSQSYNTKVLTRSASARFPSLKRSWSSVSEQSSRSPAKQKKVAQRLDSTKMRTDENKIYSCLQQQQNKSPSVGSGEKRGKQVHGRHCLKRVDVEEQCVRNSDGNNNLSGDSPRREINQHHSSSDSPRQPHRIAQSTFLHSPVLDLNHTMALNSTQQQKHLFGESVGDGVESPQIAIQGSKDWQEAENAVPCRKGKVHPDSQPVSENTTTPEYQILTKGQSSGDDKGLDHSVTCPGQDCAPALSTPPSMACLSCAPATYTTQSFLHRMTAFWEFTTLPSFHHLDLHTHAWLSRSQAHQPSRQVLLWNSQLQSRAYLGDHHHSAAGQQKPCGKRVEIFSPWFRQAVDVSQWSPAVPQPCPVYLDPVPLSLWLHEQQNQLAAFLPEPMSSLSFLGNATDAGTGLVQMWKRVDGLLSLQLYPLTITQVTPEPGPFNEFECTASAESSQQHLSLSSCDQSDARCTVAQPVLEADAVDCEDQALCQELV